MDNENQQAKNLDTLTQAIEALTTETGIQIEIQEVEGEATHPADVRVTIGPTTDIHVEIKRHAQHTNIGAIISQIQRLPDKALFVADYVNPNMAGKLKQENIQFLDTAGNAFINLEPLFIYVTGKKQNKIQTVNTRDNANRAFEPKGLMVTYAFLIDPDLLNRPYREIAAATGVALGTVGWVLKALKAGRYIHIEARDKNLRITNYQALLDRWVAAWPEKLKPKHRLGIFTVDDAYGWKGVDIENYEGYWGGETAAAMYTNHLKPEITTVYIPKNKHAKLIRDMRLRKADERDHGTGNIVELYTPFWPQENDKIMRDEKPNKVEQANGNYNIHSIITKPGLVNPVLAYADLIATGDTRNFEVARALYGECIARLDWENRP